MNPHEYSYVVVGSGLLGTVVAERIANCLNDPALVLERRNHKGGYCYSENDASTQIEYPKYGTHIFHTSDEKVRKYVNQFTSFYAYLHQVLASYNNKIYQLPINLETINSFFNVNLKPYEVDSFMSTRKGMQNWELENFKEKAIHYWASNCMWLLLKDLTASIFNRLPFRKNYDENNFFDKCQEY